MCEFKMRKWTVPVYSIDDAQCDRLELDPNKLVSVALALALKNFGTYYHSRRLADSPMLTSIFNRNE